MTESVITTLPREIEHIMRKPELRLITGLSNATIDRLEKAGAFPKRCRLSLGLGSASTSVGWHSNDVYMWLDDMRAHANTQMDEL